MHQRCSVTSFCCKVPAGAMPSSPLLLPTLRLLRALLLYLGFWVLVCLGFFPFTCYNGQMGFILCFTIHNKIYHCSFSSSSSSWHVPLQPLILNRIFINDQLLVAITAVKERKDEFIGQKAVVPPTNLPYFVLRISDLPCFVLSVKLIATCSTYQ